MRLIDLDSLPNYKLMGIMTFEGEKSPAELRIVLWEDIESMPIVDAVPVVRCRECIYYKICDEWENGKRMLCEIHHHSYLDHDGDNHFCSWGQRKKVDHEVSEP